MSQRVVVVGATGSGKTTLGRRLARRLGVPHFDFDAFYWTPGWVPAERGPLLAAIADAVAQPGWVASGNYFSSAGPLAWARADTIVWLDVSRRMSVSRVIRRTARAARTREELWPGCRQDWATAFRTGLFPQAWRQTAQLRRQLPPLVDGWRKDGIDVVRLRTPTEIDRWLAAHRGGAAEAPS